MYRVGVRLYLSNALYLYVIVGMQKEHYLNFAIASIVAN